MWPSGFAAGSPGELVKTSVSRSALDAVVDDMLAAVSSSSGVKKSAPIDVLAFVPNPLPDRLDLDLPTITILADAERSIGELRGIGRTLDNPYIFISSFLRREAVSSSRIEGTTATFEEVVFYEADPRTGNPNTDVPEVLNYINALEHGLGRVEQLPVGRRLFCELHELLLANDVRGKDKNPGQFRAVQNVITEREAGERRIRFVPPPPLQMQQALEDLERYIAAPSTIPELVQLALIHYQFEVIHPFEDGNGRIGRLLITLLLCRRRVLLEPFLYLSAYLDQHRDEYMDHLLHVSTRGDWLPWIRFFLLGIASQARDAVTRAGRLYQLARHYRSIVQQGRPSNSALKLVDHLFSRPAFTIPSIERELGITYRSAQDTVERLVALNIVAEARSSRPKIFYAPAILRTLEASTADASETAI